jgi:hypothetical protein
MSRTAEACGISIVQYAYWLRKRWVLRFVLNALSVDAWWMLRGSLFQEVGPLTEKA